MGIMRTLLEGTPVKRKACISWNASLSFNIYKLVFEEAKTRKNKKLRLDTKRVTLVASSAVKLQLSNLPIRLQTSVSYQQLSTGDERLFFT